MRSLARTWLCAWALAPAIAMADWKLDQVQDFSREQALDPAFWSLETGFFRNREKQYYTPGNASVGQGFLRIEARREAVPNAGYRSGSRGWRESPKQSEYTSASLVSRRSFQYGRFEIVARTPSGAGVWPAIWLLHESAGQYGEIDIFEAVGKHPDTAFAGVHYGREPQTRQHRNGSRVVPGLEGRWHVHAVEWTPQRIAVFLDGELLFEFDPARAAVDGTDPLRRPMQLRINLALGGSWGGDIDDSRLPARFDIASVRIWRWEPGAGTAVTPPVLPSNGALPDAPAAPARNEPPPTPRWGR